MKKIKEKIVTCLFILLKIFAASQMLNAQQPFGGGLGIPGNPYIIADRMHLEELADSVRSPVFSSNYYYYKLICDITDSVRTIIGGYYFIEEPAPLPGWPPILREVVSYFNGSFDGQGFHIVLAIKMPPNATKFDSSEYSNAGLFGKVKNAVIKNVVVSGYVEAGLSGGIVGSVTGSFFQISNCTNMAKITGGIVGGIIGCHISTGVIENCLNIENVTSTGATAGGIIGSHQSHKLTIKNCINTGIIKDGNNGGTGGIVGSIPNHTAFDITNCVNTGVLEAEPNSNPYGVGGIGPILGNTPVE